MSKASAEIPLLQAFVQEACLVSREELSGETSLQEEDHFGFMALCFAYKQLAHAHSALLLLTERQALDATVIARVMLEGTILLGWCALDPASRAVRWRAFSLVTDYRLLRRKSSNGAAIDHARLAELKDRLRDHPELLTSAARRATNESDRDPYQHSWHVDDDGARVELRSMVEELQDPTMKVLYDELSQVAHWTPAGVAFDIRHSEERSSIGFTSESMLAQAYAVVFMALSQTHLMFKQHISASDIGRMPAVIEKYVARLGAA